MGFSECSAPHCGAEASSECYECGDPLCEDHEYEYEGDPICNVCHNDLEDDWTELSALEEDRDEDY